jgi:hypothetical protein
MQRATAIDAPSTPQPDPTENNSPNARRSFPLIETKERIRSFFTFDSLMNGDLLDFEHHLNAEAVRDRILWALRSNPCLNLHPKIELLVYLPDGLPFLGEDIRRFLRRVKRRRSAPPSLGVLTRPLRGADKEAIH